MFSHPTRSLQRTSLSHVPSCPCQAETLSRATVRHDGVLLQPGEEARLASVDGVTFVNDYSHIVYVQAQPDGQPPCVLRACTPPER